MKIVVKMFSQLRKIEGQEDMIEQCRLGGIHSHRGT